MNLRIFTDWVFYAPYIKIICEYDVVVLCNTKILQ